MSNYQLAALDSLLACMEAACAVIWFVILIRAFDRALKKLDAGKFNAREDVQCWAVCGVSLMAMAYSLTWMMIAANMAIQEAFQ